MDIALRCAWGCKSCISISLSPNTTSGEVGALSILGVVRRAELAGTTKPYVVCDFYDPEHKQKYGSLTDLFGLWTPPPDPSSKKRKRTDSVRPSQLVVEVSDVLLWPITLENGMIPLPVFHVLRREGLDLSGPSHAFSRRGKAFHRQVYKDVVHTFLQTRGVSWDQTYACPTIML